MFLFYKKRLEKTCLVIALLLRSILAIISARSLFDRVSALTAADLIWGGIRLIDKGVYAECQPLSMGGDPSVFGARGGGGFQYRTLFFQIAFRI